MTYGSVTGYPFSNDRAAGYGPEPAPKPSKTAVSNPIRTEALIHDLAIVLRGCLHESAQIGPSARLAANRLRDVLGITPAYMTAGIENALKTALPVLAADVSTKSEG